MSFPWLAATLALGLCDSAWAGGGGGGGGVQNVTVPAPLFVLLGAQLVVMAWSWLRRR